MGSETKTVEFITPILDFSRREKGVFYLVIPSEEFCTEIGKLIWAWNLFENQFDMRLHELLGTSKYMNFQEKARIFKEGLEKLLVSPAIKAKLEEAIGQAQAAQGYRNAFSHRPFALSMDFREGEAFPAIVAEVGPKSQSEETFITANDIRHHTEALLRAGGLLSNLSLEEPGAWPSTIVTEAERLSLQRVFKPLRLGR